MKTFPLLAVLAALVLVALSPGRSSAQTCQAAPQKLAYAAPVVQAQTYAAPVVQAQVVAVPSFLFIVPGAPTVQIQQQAAPQYIPQATYAAPVVQAAPVLVQRQVILQQAPVVQRQIVQRAPRQRTFSIQRTVIR